MADGTLEFDTNIDNSNFEKGIKTIESAIKGVEKAVKELSGYIRSTFTDLDTSNATNQINKETSAINKDTSAAQENINAKAEMGRMAQNTASIAEKATGNVSSRMMQLNEQLRKAEIELENAKQKLQDFTSQQIPTEEYAAVEKEASKLEQKLLSLLDKKERFEETGGNTGSRTYQQMQYDIDTVEKKLESAEAEMCRLNEEGKRFKVSDEGEFEKLSNGATAAQSKVDILKQKISELSAKENETGKSGTSMFKKMSGATQNLSNKMFKATKNAAAMGETLAKNVNPAPKMISGVSKKVDALGKKLAGMVKRVFVFSMMTKAFRALRTSMQNLISSDKDMSSSLAQIKGNLLTAFAPLYSFVLPAIKNALSALVTFTNYLANVMSSIFGKTLSQSQALAKSINKSSQATDKNTKSTKKNTKEKERQLSSLDEMHKWESDNDTDSDKDDKPNTAPVFNTSEMNVDWVDKIKKLISADKWEDIGKLIANKLNDTLKKIPWDKIQQTAQSIASKLARLLNGFFSVMDLASTLGNTVAQALNTGLIFAYTFLTTFDFGQFGTFIGTSINSFIKNFNWGLLGDTLGAAVQGAIDTAYGFVTTYEWGSFASGVADSVNHFFSSIEWDKAGQTVGLAIIGIFNEISTFLKEVKWEDIGKDIGTFISNIDWNTIMSDLFGIIGDAAKGAFGIIKGVIEGLADDGITPIEVAFITLAGIISGIKLGGFIANIGKMTKAFIVNTAEIWKNVAAWIADKAETLAVYALMIKDTIQRGLHTAAIAAQTAGTWLLNAAQTALNLVMSMNPITLIIVAIAALVAAFIVLWNKCDAFREFWINLWESIKEIAGKVWEAIKEFFISAWNKITDIWKKAGVFFSGVWKKIKEVFAGVTKWFKGVFKSAWDEIKNIWNGVGKFFAGVWDGIKSTFSHVTDWFKNVFSKAWEAVKNVFSKGGKVFSGIKDGIASVFKTVVNTLINGINKIISFPFNKINSMLNKIRNVGVAGVKPFKGLWDKDPLTIPQIPKLAKGAVIPPKSEFMAVLGDQKHGTNIETPENLLRQIMREELGKINTSGGGTYEFTAQINRRTLFDERIKEGQLRKKTTGRNAFQF